MTGIGTGMPCDSLIQFECNGETLEFSVCEIDWELLGDCFGATLENGDFSEQNVTEDKIEEPEDRGEEDNEQNPIISEIYPNPVVNSVFVSIVTNRPQAIEIVVVDVNGGIIHQEDVAFAATGKFVHQINFETRLAKGMYQLHIINAKKQIVKTQSLIVAQ